MKKVSKEGYSQGFFTVDNGSYDFINTLESLKTRPTTQEEYHNSFYTGWEKGKERIKKLENFRKDSYTLDNILEQHKGLSAWYQSI